MWVLILVLYFVNSTLWTKWFTSLKRNKTNLKIHLKNENCNQHLLWIKKFYVKFCELDIELDDLPPLKETDKLENLLEKWVVTRIYCGKKFYVKMHFYSVWTLILTEVFFLIYFTQRVTLSKKRARIRVWVMVFNATVNNISVISWQSV